MIGARVYPDDEGRLRLAEGDYGKGRDGVWRCYPPGCGAGTLEDHQVTEHEDGTISVSPSIVVDMDLDHAGLGWHGVLERGVWRPC